MCMYSIGSSKPSKGERKKERKFRGRQAAALRAIKFMYDRLPERWNEWADTYFTRIMFYEKIGAKKYKGWCECGGCVDFTNARTGRKVECPVCKKGVVLKDWKRKSSIAQRDYFALVSRHDADGWIARLFVTEKETSFEGTHVSIFFNHNEEQRDYMYSDTEKFSFRPVWGGDTGDWRIGLDRVHGWGWTGCRICDQFLHLYPYNLSDLFKDSPFQYTALPIAARLALVDPLWYLWREKKEPKLEMLFKIGLYGFAQEVLNDNGWESSKKERIRKVKSLKDLGIDDPKEIEECKNLGIFALVARKEIKRWKIEETDRAAAIEFIKYLNEKSGEDFEYSFLTRQGFFKYWLSQKETYPNVRNFINDYVDYASTAHHLGLDLKNTKISKPHDFKTMHDWAINEEKVQETKVYDAQILALYNSIHKLCEWEDNVYAVIMPSTSREIVEEGVRQSHCVGRYCERVAKGESVILFVRRKDKISESWYTMEIKRNMDELNIVQCRGYDNQDRNEEEAAEIEKVKAKYTAWFNRRSSGGYQSEIMATYYKAVRKKNGKYISNFDNKTEYVVGAEICAKMDKNPDKYAVEGLHVASLEFAQRFGDSWKDVAILEVQVNIHDVIVPDALDQVRASRLKVVREVPMSELGEWGRRHIEKQTEAA